MMVRRHEQSGDGIDTNPWASARIFVERTLKTATNLSARMSWAGFEAEMHHVDYRHTYLVRENDDMSDHLAADGQLWGCLQEYVFPGEVWCQYSKFGFP